jgi:hypothetical protein
MVVLPAVLGCRPLRRTIQARLGTNTLHAAQAPALRAVARWRTHLRGLATAIHETYRLCYKCSAMAFRSKPSLRNRIS